MTDVLIHSPFPRLASQGNSVTSDRLEKILVAAGYDVTMETEHYQGGDARCMIALNARRSAEAVREFKASHSDRSLIVILTGTDINHREVKEPDSPTRRTMDVADVLVVLHEADLASVPEDHLIKTKVIYPSVIIPDGTQHRANHGKPFKVIMAGNLRSVKNPQLAVAASRQLPVNTPVTIQSFGDASGELAEEMRQASDELTNFAWNGKIQHDALIEEMVHAHVLLNTSTQEGGANAICEAISLGLPVVASHIRGNIGMLGNEYQGFFPSEDAEALASILHRCATDSAYYSILKQQVAARAPLFAYSTESASWTDFVRAQLSS